MSRSTVATTCDSDTVWLWPALLTLVVGGLLLRDTKDQGIWHEVSAGGSA